MRRREFVLGAAASVLAGGARAQQASVRIAAIDWAMLETLISLGMMPVAATELIQFRKDAVEPAIPGDVVDLGLRGTPNFELLHLLKPNLILISPFYTRHQAALERIAPIVSLPFYSRGEPPFAKALAAVTMLGERLGRQEIAAQALANIAARLETGKLALARFAGRPTYLVNVGDARHVRVFGSDSMFGDVMSRLGLPNAWTEQSRYTFAAPVPIENLSAANDARIVVISEIPVEARSGLRNSMIWNSLEPVRKGRVLMLDNINPYGGVTAGMRFARLLSDALLTSGERG
jgi:iron complex transport system substrate-binding protein